MDKHNHFKIIRDKNGHYVVINMKGDYEHHTHIRNYNTCELLINLVCKKVVPDKDYLRSSAKRISRDWKYIDKIDRKIKKDKNRQRYHNVGGRGNQHW